MKVVPAIAVTCAALAAAGCVERKMLIRSEPQGAIVRLDGNDMAARTPVELPATFDGPHRVELLANGYRPLTAEANVPARWHDWFPLDVFAEFLWPGTIRETHVFDFRMEPYVPLTEKLTPQQDADLAARVVEVKSRADEYRRGGAAGPASPVALPKPADTAPPPPPPPPPPPTRPAPPPGGGSPK